MDEKVLKKIIKQLVRESLTEIFAEMKLETIVENVVSRKVSKAPVVSSKLSVKEALGVRDEVQPSRPSSSTQIDAEQKRKFIIEKMGGNDMWKGIYADTAATENPILEGDNAGADQEQVPASILENMGLMRDYSKHIGMDDEKTKDNDEWQKLRVKRQKILDESIKRG